jgi:hypothetical protein
MVIAVAIKAVAGPIKVFAYMQDEDIVAAVACGIVLV